MKLNDQRREFLKTTALSGLSISLFSGFTELSNPVPQKRNLHSRNTQVESPDLPFIPHRMASWWVTIEDLQWPQKEIVDKIKRRAAAFAEAKIDTAINFGCHIRFDFSNYFGHLHGYYAQVCEELHRYDIKFMDHYSCNHVERPRGSDQFRELHRSQRHHTLLFHDPIAANYAQYEGYRFQDICQVNIVDGSRGYASQYQLEAFCHNNPDFLDMHSKYLQRLLKEVPLDGIEVDDMCNYAGYTVCGCDYCRDRFRKDYGHEIPSFDEESFWGDTTKPMLQWGNYDNTVFRDWIQMRTDAIVDHVKMIKAIIGNKPLMTCISAAGPIVLNGISLDLEKLALHLDFFMLENTGFNIDSVNWVRKDAEAMNQKDIADKRGKAAPIALSYTIYEEGAYLGWALSRYWGVANWSCTLNGRLVEDPPDAMEMEDVIRDTNLWEFEYSCLDFREGSDLVEVRLVHNIYCRYNGWRDEDGMEHWDRVTAWSEILVRNNIGYRFVRSDELGDARSLQKVDTPLILDGVGCVSDAQFLAIKSFLSKGGKVWLALPFGSHDEKGSMRSKDLYHQLSKEKYKNLTVIDSAVQSQPLNGLISSGDFIPVIQQVSGGKGWAVRIRFQKDKPVLHFMNAALTGVPHPTIKDNSNTAILADIKSSVENNDLRFKVNSRAVDLSGLVLRSPEIGGKTVAILIENNVDGSQTIRVNLEGVSVYGVAQGLKISK